MALPTQNRESALLKRAADIVWAVFLIWSTVGLLILPLNINAYNIEDFTRQRDLVALGKVLLPYADAVWMTLAGVCTYLLLTRLEGLDHCRRIALVVLLGSGVVEFIGASTGQPFGPYLYTGNLGNRILGVLPYTIPLAWLVILAASRHILLLAGLPWNRWLHAALIGLMAVLTDVNLEQVAWKVRQYWIWYPGRTEIPYPEWPPLQNFISWFALAFLLAAAFPPPRGGFTPRFASWQLAAMLVVINLLFLVTHLFGWLGWRI